MAPLTKDQRKTIGSALSNANRAAAYLRNPRTAVAARGNFATTSLHYSRADGTTLYEVEKEYGSDLTGLWHAIKLLEQLLSQ